MKLSIFARLLTVERYRQRISNNPSVATPPVPLMIESDRKDVEPAVVTTTRGQFVATRLTKDGSLRSGVAEIPIELEEHLLVALHKSLYTIGKTQKWGNLCKTIPEACLKLGAFNRDVSAIVASPEMIATIIDAPIKDLPLGLDGWLAKVNNKIDVFLCHSLPSDKALVFASPADAGVYTRIGDHLSMSLHNVERTIMVVGSYVVVR